MYVPIYKLFEIGTVYNWLIETTPNAPAHATIKVTVIYRLDSSTDKHVDDFRNYLEVFQIVFFNNLRSILMYLFTSF